MVRSRIVCALTSPLMTTSCGKTGVPCMYEADETAWSWPAYYVAFLMKIDVVETITSKGYILTFSGVVIAANVFMVVVTVLIQKSVLLANEMRTRRNAPRVSDTPVHRTQSVSQIELRLLHEGGACKEEGAALESKDSDI